MPLVLAVENESRYVERIRDALLADGWQVEAVARAEQAIEKAAAAEPSLVLINVEVAGAAELLTRFSRAGGGVGAVALLPEVGSATAEVLATRADGRLVKPFAASDLRLLVKRCVSAGRRAPGPGKPEKAEGRQLTSQEIFGDLLAEFEAAPPPAAASRPTKPRELANLSDAEIDRKLEETLSGVLGAPRKPPAATKRRSGDEEVDELISRTLLNLDLDMPRPSAARAEREQRAAATPAAAPPPAGDAPAAAAAAAAPEPGPPPAPPGTPPPALAGGAGAATQAIPTLARSAEEEGRQFGQYALLEKIAVGGMAEVWKARMRGVEGFQKTVAIKKILPHLTDSSSFISMFVDEAKLAAQLSHPNITHIYDLGKIDVDYYIAMEYVEGRNLRAILNTARRRGVRVPLGLALMIAARLASALDYAHRKRGFDDKELGLVHRDVSPQNVLISYEGDIKLCDFGIVKAVTKASHTQMGALKGKLQYMSPEQAWGRAVDGRSDLFSLGALLFEILTARRLFPGDNEISVLEAVRQCRIDPPRQLDPTLPAEVEAIVLKALAKEPDARFQSAGALQQELEGVLYTLRPTPSQADLAAFMHALFAGGGVGAADEEEIEEAPSPAPAVAAAVDLDEELPLPPELPEVAAPGPEPAAPPAAEAEQAAAAPAEKADGEGADEQGEEPERAEPPPAATVEPARPPRAAAARPEPAPVAAVAPRVGRVEIEEGGARGRAWLIAAIGLILIVLALGWRYWPVLQPIFSTPEAPPGAAVPLPEAEGAAAPAAGDTGGAPEAAAPAPEGGAREQRHPGAAPAAPHPATAPEPVPPAAGVSVEKMVDEELARREAELRRRLEEEQKRLEKELAATQATGGAKQPAPAVPAAGATESPPSRPPPATAAGGAPPAAAESAATAPQATAQEPPPGPPAGEAATTAPPPATTPPTPAPQPPAPPPAAASAAGQGTGGPRSGETAAGGGRRGEPQPSPPAPSPVRVGQLVEPGPGVVAPVLVSIAKPEYPPLARRLRVEGVVEIELLIDENGNVSETRMSRPIRQDVGINEAALAAARTAKFKPATKDGVRVKIWTRLKVPFKL
jgi:TonB family protein